MARPRFTSCSPTDGSLRLKWWAATPKMTSQCSRSSRSAPCPQQNWAQFCCGQGALRLDLEHCDVIFGVAAHHFSLKLPSVGEHDVNRGRAMDHVVVGDDDPSGIDDHPAAQALN